MNIKKKITIGGDPSDLREDGIKNNKEKLFWNQHDKTNTKMGGRSVIDSFGLYGSPLLYCNRDTEDAQPSATCILNKALPTRNGCNKFS